MDAWHQIGTCLDGGLMGALKIEGCSASVGTGKADAAQLSDIVEASGADCRVQNAGVAACPSPGLTPYSASAPETAPARRQAGEVLRLELVVDNSRRPIRPNTSAFEALGLGRRLWLIAKDGERVHYSAASR